MSPTTTSIVLPLLLIFGFAVAFACVSYRSGSTPRPPKDVRDVTREALWKGIASGSAGAAGLLFELERGWAREDARQAGKACIGCDSPQGDRHEPWCPVVTGKLSSLDDKPEGGE